MCGWDVYGRRCRFFGSLRFRQQKLQKGSLERDRRSPSSQAPASVTVCAPGPDVGALKRIIHAVRQIVFIVFQIADLKTTKTRAGIQTVYLLLTQSAAYSGRSNRFSTSLRPADAPMGSREGAYIYRTRPKAAVSRATSAPLPISGTRRGGAKTEPYSGPLRIPNIHARGLHRSMSSVRGRNAVTRPPCPALLPHF